ncbi:polysaccharide deacetylase family protein [Ningiella sp. W23]|uniref:polysaccharide deacetylase family protein n=1 Tax=Ningiella sp. W23 TaxID=3023715 RepID=UPI003757C487
MLRSLAILFILFGLSACHSARHVELDTADYMIVKAGSSDTFASLSKQYLGTEYAVDALKRLNPHITEAQNQMVAIPKSNPYPRGIFSDRYQLIPVLCYHQFTDDPSKVKPMVLHVDDFKKQMAYLQENGYSVITLEQLSAFVNGELSIPEKSVVITIDDGYKSFYEYAFPILEQYQFDATVFIYPDFVGGRLSLTWKQLNQLEAHPLISIESHSNTHDNLKRRESDPNLNRYLDRLEQEVITPQRYFDRRLNKQTQFFAYPFGDTSRELIDLLDKQDYELAFTVERGSNAAYSPEFLMKRNMIFGGRSFNDFVRALDTYEPLE